MSKKLPYFGVYAGRGLLVMSSGVSSLWILQMDRTPLLVARHLNNSAFLAPGNSYHGNSHTFISIRAF